MQSELYSFISCECYSEKFQVFQHKAMEMGFLQLILGWSTYFHICFSFCQVFFLPIFKQWFLSFQLIFCLLVLSFAVFQFVRSSSSYQRDHQLVRVKRNEWCHEQENAIKHKVYKEECLLWERKVEWKKKNCEQKTNVTSSREFTRSAVYFIWWRVLSVYIFSLHFRKSWIFFFQI